MKTIYLTICLLCPFLAQAELIIALSPLKVAGQKVIVPLALKNDFQEKIESARATVFLLDEHGKMIGNGTKWVIGGNEGQPGLGAGMTNLFHFVVAAGKPITSTNLTARVTFSRIVLADGKLADMKRDVRIQSP